MKFYGNHRNRPGYHQLPGRRMAKRKKRAHPQRRRRVADSQRRQRGRGRRHSGGPGRQRPADYPPPPDRRPVQAPYGHLQNLHPGGPDLYAGGTVLPGPPQPPGGRGGLSGRARGGGRGQRPRLFRRGPAGRYQTGRRPGGAESGAAGERALRRRRVRAPSGGGEGVPGLRPGGRHAGRVSGGALRKRGQRHRRQRGQPPGRRGFRPVHRPGLLR